nr:hypothetical protein [Tanacetum cinerariifolium]
MIPVRQTEDCDMFGNALCILFPTGLPKLKFVKDHLCSSCELGKAKRNSFHTKLTPSSKRRLQLLHMDLCGPIGLQAQVRVVQTDKGTEFLNQTLYAYFDAEGILHQTSVPEQNGVVERRNCTLVEAARTMLSAAKVPLFFWAEAIATACFTQNRSLVIPRHEKIPYHIINDQKPSVKFFHIFGFMCYIVRDGENLDKMKEKGDECIFVSLSPANQRQATVPQADRTVTTSNELDLLFSLMFDELLNGSSKVVSKSSAVSAADAPNQRQNLTTPLNNHTASAPTCQVLTLAPTVISSENINQAETYAENAQVTDDYFINIFSTPVQDQGETSSRHVDLSNMHTFYQRYPSEHRWTKDHPLEQVIVNPSQSIRTRRQLESDAEMCMFALTVSRTEPKNIKEAMADSRVIMESIHVNFDELPQQASAHDSSDPGPSRHSMASAHNSSDPAPTCQTKASVQISSDPAPECQTMALEHGSLSPRRNCQENVSHRDKTGTTSNELDLLFSPMFDELLNGSSKVVTKSSAVSAVDAPYHRQQPTTPLNNHTTPAPTCQNPPITTSVISSEIINQAEPHAENAQVADDEFINIFSTPVQDQGVTSSRHVDSSNMHTFYQRYPSEQRWTKDHPLEQVIGNPSQSVRTRRQLESDAEMCMFALTTMASAHNSSDPAPICQKMASIQISSDPAPECQTMALEHGSLSPGRKCQENVSHGDKTGTTSNELDLLFSPMFDELLNGTTKVVSKSSAVSAVVAPNQRQQPTTPLNNHTTPAPT